MKSVNGLVKPITPDVTANYENHSLVVSYRPAGMQNVLNPPEESLTVAIAQTGEFLFQIPDEGDLIGQVNLSVRGPVSEIFSQDYDYADLEAVDITTKAASVSSTPVEIEVDPQLAIVLPNEPGTSAYKVRGRVINFEDGAAIPGRTLFIYVHLQSDDETKPLDELPVLTSVKTDSTGYFSFDMSGAPIRQAFLNIAGLERETFFLQNAPSDVEQLKASQVVVVDGSMLPDLDANDDDCGCHSQEDVVQLPDAEDLALSGAYSDKNGKRCVDFTQPNRSLEEFSYVKIVRTTEPEFKKIPYRKPPLLKVPNGSNFANVITSVEEVSEEPVEGGSDGAKIIDPNAGSSTGNETIPKDLADFYTYLQDSWVQNSKYWVFVDRPYELVDTSKMIFTPKADSYHLYDPVALWMTTLEELYVYINQNAHNSEGELLDFLTFIRQQFVTENRRQPGNPDDLEDFVRLFFEEGSRGRVEVDSRHGIDWDESPTLYQNTSIAHGHLLHFKQIWRADGYSMGDLLYSLPLAPCQKKQIAIFDWGRTESAGRTEALTAEEQLSAHLNRDRDVTDIVNTSLSEQIKGGSESELYSKSKTKSFGGGIGAGGSMGGSGSASASKPGASAEIGASASLGVSAGFAGGVGVQTNESSSSASAFQDSARDLAASSLSNLRDSVMQSASSIRSQRSTVIETVSQGETMNVQTEVIANKMHCHSLTVQYFEVLRHFAIEQKVVDVQECLFIPLEMSAFTAEKILRWKDELFRALPASGLRDGVLALEDIQRKYRYANPNEILADEPVQEIFGQVLLSVNVNRPPDDELVDEEEFQPFNAGNWAGLTSLLGNWNTAKIRSIFEKKLQAERDKVWNTEILPEIIANFLDQLEIDAYDKDNNELGLKLEMTVEPNPRSKYSRLRGKAALKKARKIAAIKNYQPGSEMKLLLRLFPSENNVSRSDIAEIRIKNNFQLPEGSNVVFFGGFLRYTSESLNETLFSTSERHAQIDPDITLSTPLNQREMFNPVKEAYKTANRLIEHINDHLEYYHKVVWFQMDSDKRYMILDGFIAPNSGGRSVASVIENRLVDIVGNNLVMPVARGVRIDPTYKQDDDKPVDLLKQYAPNTPIPPFRVSVPTRGVYAEAVMGQCNSCEEIDESRHWRFHEVPCGDEPTAIQPINTDTRRADPGDLTAKDLPQPIVNIQNAPAAPDPQGFAGALDALTNGQAFRDITGLNQTQLNALEALKTAASGSSDALKNSLDAAKEYAAMAKDLAMHASSIKNGAKTQKAINDAKNKGDITDDQHQELTYQNLKSQVPSLMKDSKDIPTRDGSTISNLIPKNPGQFSSFEASDGDGSLKFSTPHSGYGMSGDGPTATEALEDLLNDPEQWGAAPMQPLRLGDFDETDKGQVKYNGNQFAAEDGQAYLQVRALQTDLANIGLSEIVGPASGTYDGRTAIAVAIFQGFAQNYELGSDYQNTVVSPIPTYNVHVTGNADSYTRTFLRDFATELGLSLPIEALNERLAGLGFAELLDDNRKAYTWKTYFAVREFQIYAKMDQLVAAPTSGGFEIIPTGPLADHYQTVGNGNVYEGPVNGVVDHDVQELLDYWLENNYRCPVLFEAWTMNGTTRVDLEAEGFWEHDDVENNGLRVFAVDPTGYYTLPNTRLSEDRIVVGEWTSWGNWGGPQALPYRNQNWLPEMEILPESLTGQDWATMTTAQQSTFRAVRSVSEIETFGVFDSINAYDRAVLSVGPYHWTILKMTTSGVLEEGELMAFFSYMREAEPALYEEFFGNFGVSPDKEWAGDGADLFGKINHNYTDRIRFQVTDDVFVQGPNNVPAIGHYFRTWHWYYRMQMMMRTSDRVKELMWNYARIRMRDILECQWDKDSQVDDGQGGNRKAKIGDYYTSEKAIAMLTRWHVRFPSHIIQGTEKTGGRAGANLLAAFKASGVTGDPANWTDQDEEALINALIAQGANADDMQPHLNRINDWPNSSAIAYYLSLNTTGGTFTGDLDGTRNSLDFDDSNLPAMPE